MYCGAYLEQAFVYGVFTTEALAYHYRGTTCNEPNAFVVS